MNVKRWICETWGKRWRHFCGYYWDDVELCKETKKLARNQCPEKEAVRVKRREKPTELCPIHLPVPPPPPPPPKDDQKDLVLSAYRLISACRGNVPSFLKRCRETGVTRLRVFAVATWGGAQFMQPDRSDYWERMEARIVQIRDSGLGIDLDLEDGNSLDGAEQRARHWFLSDLGFDPREWPVETQERRKQYVARWIILLGAAGIDFRLAVINEPFGPMLEFIRWHAEFINDKNGCNVPTSCLIQSTSPSWTLSSSWQYAGILAPHGIWHKARIGLIPYWAASIVRSLGLKLLYSGDGNIPFPTSLELAALGLAIRRDPLAIGYEMKANEEVGHSSLYMDVDAMDWSRVEAISKTLKGEEKEK